MIDKILSVFFLFLILSCSVNSNLKKDINVSSIHSVKNSFFSLNLYKVNENNPSGQNANINVVKFLQAYQIDEKEIDPFEKYKNLVPYSPTNDLRFRVIQSSEVIISVVPRNNSNNSITLLNNLLEPGYYLLSFSEFNIKEGLYCLHILMDNSTYEKDIILMK
ncbi:MAG: hypothetical protein K8S23_16435 [Candidatus Cloacimonetes bacterium]|nr:hypothetical protein [Candidatus Cloacimonadota bacterium]